MKQMKRKTTPLYSSIPSLRINLNNPSQEWISRYVNHSRLHLRSPAIPPRMEKPSRHCKQSTHDTRVRRFRVRVHPDTSVALIASVQIQGLSGHLARSCKYPQYQFPEILCRSVIAAIFLFSAASLLEGDERSPPQC